MKYKIYYYKEHNTCIITKETKVQPDISSFNAENIYLKIELENRMVDKLYDFFKETVIQQLLSDSPSAIEIDYSEISEMDFFKEDSFVKLIALIDEIKNKCNETIEKFIEVKSDEK